MSKRNGEIALIRGPEEFSAAFAVSRQVVDRLADLRIPAAAMAEDHQSGGAQHVGCGLAPPFRGFGPAGGAGSAVRARGSIWGRERGFRGWWWRSCWRGCLPPPSLLRLPPPLTPPRKGEGDKRSHVTLIESNARKCAFLREVVRQTGVAQSVSVDILSTRIEAAATQASLAGPDVVTARALASLSRLLELSAPLFASRTVGLFLKGRDAATELEAARKSWSFNAELIPSRTEAGAHVVAVRDLEPQGKAKGSIP